MSIPTILWTLERGRALKLSPHLRMLLIAIADRQNGHAYCTAGQECLANDTGLTSRSVRDLAPQLERLGLISIERLGRFIRYQVLRPRVAETASGNRPHKAEAASGNKPEASSGNGQATPEAASGKVIHKAEIASGVHRSETGSRPPRHRKLLPKIPEAASDKPVLNQENLRGARETHAPNQASKVVDLEEKQEERAPPTAPRIGPPEGAPPPEGAIRNPNVRFEEWVDRGCPPEDSPLAATNDRRSMHCEQPAEELTEDDVPRTPEDRARMAEQLAGLAKSIARGFHPTYPPRTSSLNASEQAEAVQGPQRPRAYHLAGAQLAALRHAAGYGP